MRSRISAASPVRPQHRGGRYPRTVRAASRARVGGERIEAAVQHLRRRPRHGGSLDPLQAGGTQHRRDGGARPGRQGGRDGTPWAGFPAPASGCHAAARGRRLRCGAAVFPRADDFARATGRGSASFRRRADGVRPAAARRIPRAGRRRAPRHERRLARRARPRDRPAGRVPPDLRQSGVPARPLRVRAGAVGACCGCAQKVRDPDGAVRVAMVCSDGPVFQQGAIVWD